MTRRPRLLLLADRPNWAFDYVARSLRRRLARELDVRIDYAAHRPDLERMDFDLLHVFFWGDGWHRRFKVPRDRLIVEVASHRWKEEPYSLDAGRFAASYLAHCDTATTPSEDLRRGLEPHFPRIFLTPNGYEPGLFHPGRRPSGGLKIAWAGRPEDPCKGLFDILLPACEGRFDFRWTDGTWSRGQVARLFRSSDVVAVASTAESQPLPLIEGMACGCFPVTTAVGVAPRLVEHGRNGLLVEERSVDAFRDALAWCERNLGRLRDHRGSNARLMRLNRSWDRCALYYLDVYRHVLRRRGCASEEPPADLRRVAEAPAMTGENGGLPEPLRTAAGGLRWRLSDLGADLRHLSHVARRDGLAGLSRSRLFSPRWYHRSLGRLLRRLR